ESVCVIPALTRPLVARQVGTHTRDSVRTGVRKSALGRRRGRKEQTSVPVPNATDQPSAEDAILHRIHMGAKAQPAAKGRLVSTVHIDLVPPGVRTVAIIDTWRRDIEPGRLRVEVNVVKSLRPCPVRLQVQPPNYTPPELDGQRVVIGDTIAP